MKVIFVSMILMYFCCKEIQSARNKVLKNKIGGEFFSPNYPKAFPNNTRRKYYIKAPKNHFIVLKFTTFHIGGTQQNKSNYFEIFDGKKIDQSKPRFFNGRLKTPFYFISNTNRLRIKMVSDNLNNSLGFHAFYNFEDSGTSCDVTNLKTMGNTINWCNNFSNSLSSKCSISCKSNYRLQGTNESTCVDGKFTAVHCNMQEDIVNQCEDSEFNDCPYEYEEILDYYLNHQLISGANLTEEDLLAIQAAEVRAVGRGGGRCSRYCVRSPWSYKYIYPPRCGALRNYYKKRACASCRIRNLCSNTAKFFN